MSFVIGEDSNGNMVSHVVDPAGPDPLEVVKADPPSNLSYFKTNCGRHLGADALEEAPAGVPLCQDC